jgi:hypothetical protein
MVFVSRRMMVKRGPQRLPGLSSDFDAKLNSPLHEIEAHPKEAVAGGQKKNHLR